jgi:integrase
MITKAAIPAPPDTPQPAPSRNQCQSQDSSVVDKQRLREVVEDLEAGVTAGLSYSVKDAIEDFLSKGLKGKSEATISNYRSLATRNLIPQIGEIKLKALTADRLDTWIDERAGELSTRSLRLIHQILERAIRHAQARDQVRRNVASLITLPEGRPGRPSKAMTLDQAVKLLRVVGPDSEFRLSAYVVLSLLTGVRTEEARALHWSEVDLKAGTVAVFRSVRAKGDTKTRRSRRVLRLPKQVTAALKAHHRQQAADRLQAGGVARSRPGFQPGRRYAARPLAGAPGVRRDHQGGRAGGGLDTP